MGAASWRIALFVSQALTRPCGKPQQHWQHQRHLSSNSVASSSSITSTGATANSGVTSSCCIYEDDQLRIRTEELPLPVWKAMQQLRAAGHSVLLVGGAVRDLLLGSLPKDYDLLTSAHLNEVKQLLPKPRIFGRTFPICQLDVDGVRIEISSMHTRPPFRITTAARVGSDAAVAGVPPDAAQILQAGPKAAVVAATAAAAATGGQIGRHRRVKQALVPRPHHQQQQQQQRPLSWAAARRENALARDFTVNCLLYDPFAGLLFDYAGGVADLQSRVLRCNGSAAERFARDPACMLRAVRCAARAGLEVEQQTMAALQQHSSLISSLNSHRLTAELQAMLGYGAAAPSLQLLKQTQLLPHLLPLHAAYMLRQQHNQQALQNSCSNRVSIKCTNSAAADASSRSDKAFDGCGSSSRKSNSSSSSSSGSTSQHSAADKDQQWQQLSQVDDQQQAYSALGQLWSQFQTTPCPQQQQKQKLPHEQVQALQQQHEQLQYSNLLLRVLAALDTQVSVSQPASAEVLLTCLTAPLLVEALTAAVEQLQRHVQKQQQLLQRQVQQQKAAARQAQQPPIEQQQQHEPWPLSVAAAGLSPATADGLTVLLHGAPAARRIARPFSSSSSTSSSSDQATLRQPTTERSAATGHDVSDLVQQLLQGTPAVECIQQQAVQLAAQVCHGAAFKRSATEEEQHGYQAAACGYQLFGAHAPQQVAQILQACLQPSQPQSADCDHASAESAQAQGCPSSGGRSSSRQQQTKPARKHSDLWDEYAAALPRSNKQFRQLMQKQRNQQLQGMPGGFVGMLATDAGLLMDADAGPGKTKAAQSSASSGGDELAGPTADRSASQLAQLVLQVAGVNLRGLQQRLQTVQAMCLQLQAD